MAGSRKWVTREEIAEIHEARADNIERLNGRDGVFRNDEVNRLRKQAADIRATERLTRPLGDRVA